METSLKNIFQDIPEKLPDELFQTIFKNSHVHIERIVSKGHRTAPDHWYDQDHTEFVLVLKGAATLKFADQPESIQMYPGDYLIIPPHQRHQITWTDPQQETIWLAVHVLERR